MKNKIISFILVIVCMISVLPFSSIAVAAAQLDKLDADIKFSSASQIMQQYITNDGKTAKLINNNNLYSYDIDSGSITLEYKFPKSKVFNESVSTPDANQTYCLNTTVSAYINENTGLLYFAYDKYSQVHSAQEECVEIIVYDLEKSALINTIKLEGTQLSAIGSDNNGNIYVGIDEEWFSENKSVVLLSQTGAVLSKTDVECPVRSFCGFCEDQSFFYIDEYVYYSMGVYPNSMGRLARGFLNGTDINLEDSYMFYVKNISFEDYYNSVEIVNNKYLTTYTGQIIELSGIKDNTYSVCLYTPRNLEMGGYYGYIYNAGTNICIDGDMVYSLSDNDTIMCYSLSSKDKLSSYDTDNYVFNMKLCGDYLLALETDGTNFYYEKIDTSTFAAVSTTTVSMNDFSVYKDRTKNDIVKRYSEAVPKDYTKTLYETLGSNVAPYKESTLTEEAKDISLKFSNYTRWLGGLTEFSRADEPYWNNAAKGAVLLSAGGFTHTPAKPSDMSDEFYKDAYNGTSSSSIATCRGIDQSSIISSIRLLMNDLGYTSPGHRNNFLTRNGNEIAYGFCNDGYMCQTVLYEKDPNPQGTAIIDNNEAAYAWPAPGYFPAEELSTGAYWTVNLNTDKIQLSNKPLTVTITDLDTNEVFTRDSSATGLYATTYWGRYISFAPPELNSSSYAGKKYKISLSNLADEHNMPIVLEYTVEFFSYVGDYTIDGVNVKCDSYGHLTEKSVLGDVDSDGKLTICDATVIQRHLAGYLDNNGKPLIDVSNKYELKTADVDGDGKVTIIDATKIQRILASLE